MTDLLSISELRTYLKTHIVPFGFKYVYCIHDAAGKLRYVGKGSGNRAAQHISTRYMMHLPLYQWLHSQKTVLYSIYYVSKDDNVIDLMESVLIDEIGYSNLLNDRNGTSFSLKNGEWIQTNRLKVRRKVKETPEEKAERLKRTGLLLRGRKLSKETRERMSESRLGRKQSEESIRKMSESRKVSIKVKQAAIARTNPVKIHGIRYHNLYQASLALNVNYNTLRYRLVNNHEGYRYAS